MQCLGRTQTLKRCKRQTPFVVCNHHRFQPLVAVISLLGFVGLLAGLYQDAWKPVFSDDIQASDVSVGHPDGKMAQEDRHVTLIDLGYKLFSYGIVEDADHSSLDENIWAQEIEPLYGRIGISVVAAEFGPETFKSTRESLDNDRDKEFLDVGMLLAAGTLYGSAILLHRDKPYGTQGEIGLKGVIDKLRHALLSLGLLEGLGDYSDLETHLYPSEADTVDTYSVRQEMLRSAIVGETRRRHGF